MPNVINSSMANEPYYERKILSYVDVIRKRYPSIKVKARGSAWSDIEWLNPADATTLTEAILSPLIIECTIIDWIHILFTEANNVQEFASTYFTFSNRGTVHTQVSMYDQKYIKAKEYIYELSVYTGTFEEAKLNVPVPSMIQNEAVITGDDPYDLSQAILQNYLDSNDAMTAYYGTVEGERRLAKRRILECASISDLENLQWATWPEFIPPSENIGD